MYRTCFTFAKNQSRFKSRGIKWTQYIYTSRKLFYKINFRVYSFQ